MRPSLLSRRDIQRMVHTRDPFGLESLRRMIAGRVQTFETAVYWPALAASWREDLEVVERKLEEMGC